MAFTLPDLPFDKAALAPHMSEETLEFHHGKHHQAYVDKTNKLVAKGDLADASLVEVIRAANERGNEELFNNAGQLWNHSFFWQCLAPRGGKPSGDLKDRIASDFGSVDKLIEALSEEAVAHFASGWAWLVLEDDALKVISLHDGDTPVAHEGIAPLFTLDVWEHAYYIDYRNKRPDYVKAVLANLVDWDFVARNLDGRGVGRADQKAMAAA